MLLQTLCKSTSGVPEALPAVLDHMPVLVYQSLQCFTSTPPSAAITHVIKKLPCAQDRHHNGLGSTQTVCPTHDCRDSHLQSRHVV